MLKTGALRQFPRVERGLRGLMAELEFGQRMKLWPTPGGSDT